MIKTINLPLYAFNSFLFLSVIKFLLLFIRFLETNFLFVIMKYLLLFVFLTCVFCSEEFYLLRVSPNTKKHYEETKESLTKLKEEQTLKKISTEEFMKQSKDKVRDFKRHCFKKRVKREIFLGLVVYLRAIFITDIKSIQRNDSPTKPEEKNNRILSKVMFFVVSILIFSILACICQRNAKKGILLIYSSILSLVCFIIFGGYFTLFYSIFIFIIACLI